MLAGLSVAGVGAASAQPTLGIVPSNNQLTIRWPATATNYVLLCATNLDSPNWTPPTDAIPATYGSDVAVVVTEFPPARFFVLFHDINTPAGMALVPGGDFEMGDTQDGWTPADVYVASFYMDVNLVTYSLWRGVYSYAVTQGYGFDHAGSGKAMNHPVQTVNWYDAIKWCNARSQQAGLTPVYYTDARFAQIYKTGQATNLFAQWDANGYRLPTSAEWEKAARGGFSGLRFPWGDTISENQANYSSTNKWSYDLGPYGYNSIGVNSGAPYTTPVGTFPPNGYGLYDMAGNVFEWCWDPTGTPSGSGRIINGSSWFNQAVSARCGSHPSWPADAAASNCGFRCVRGH